MGAFRAALFDLDGTLLDSMEIWEELGCDFLRRRGVTPPEHFKETIAYMSMHGAVRYMAEHFPVGCSVEEISQGMDEILGEFYAKKPLFKPGAVEFLRELKSRHIPAGIVSATPERHVRAALERLGALEFFPGGILSGEDLHMSKKNPEIFFRMMERLKSTPAESLVFEDALYAVKTAHQAGFALCGVFDASEPHADEVRALCRWYIRRWDEFPRAVLD